MTQDNRVMDVVAELMKKYYPMDSEQDRDELENAIWEAYTRGKEEERERCIDVVIKSRTIDEHLGVSVRCETARAQAVVDLLTPTTSKSGSQEHSTTPLTDAAIALADRMTKVDTNDIRIIGSQE